MVKFHRYVVSIEPKNNRFNRASFPKTEIDPSIDYFSDRLLVPTIVTRATITARMVQNFIGPPFISSATKNINRRSACFSTGVQSRSAQLRTINSTLTIPAKPCLKAYNCRSARISPDCRVPTAHGIELFLPINCPFGCTPGLRPYEERMVNWELLQAPFCTTTCLRQFLPRWFSREELTWDILA